VKFLPGALLALSIARLWLMPLPSSFWLDETATVFVARYGSSHWSLAAAAPQAWQSIYYPVARASAACFGSSEIAYRLPSVLLMGAALFLVARLAARLIHPEAGWFAVFACLALRGINYEAADARPYAMGMCVAAAAMLLLVRWFDSGRWRDGLLFVLCGTLLWRVHLLFWPIYLVFAAYALARRTRRARTAILFAVVAVALVPVLLDALALSRDASAHAFASTPGMRDFVSSLKLPLLLICGAGAAFWRRGKPVSLPAATLVLGWWLALPVSFFIWSRLTGSSLFVPRYLSLSLPGAALTATLVAASWIPADRLKPAGVLLGLGALVLLGQWQQLWPRHHNSDWRAAARAVNAIAAHDNLPVLCPSPFVEAVPPAWRPDYPLPGFLYSQLDTYPIAGHPLLLPYRNEPVAAPQSDRFLVYGWEPQVHALETQFIGWRARRLGPFADVNVVLFERPVN